MRITSTSTGLLALAAALVLAACQDLPGPTEPAADPAFNAQTTPGLHRAQDVAAWFRTAAPDVMALPGTVFADHDESANVLVFGIESANAMFGVQNALARRGVPATAYRVQVVEPIRFMSDNLRSAHRPTVGGIQIHWGNYLCTLGFNVDHAGGRSFITNSHCTNKQGTTGTTAYYQPLSSAQPTPIADEAHDPAYSSLPGCSAGKKCRYSDAARVLYRAGTSSTRGSIARTTGVNNGSLVVIGAFTINAQNSTATSYSGTVHKVGRTTGWSSGNVTNTCATVNVSGSNIQLICQTLVSNNSAAIVGAGDSGSPVFRRTSEPDVELIGILWGGSGSSLFVFSPLKNIQDELGGLAATFEGSGGGSGGGGGGEEPPPEEPKPCVPKGPQGKNCK
jgi:hypothetical protein